MNKTDTNTNTNEFKKTTAKPGSILLSLCIIGIIGVIGSSLCYTRQCTQQISEAKQTKDLPVSDSEKGNTLSNFSDSLSFMNKDFEPKDYELPEPLASLTLNRGLYRSQNINLKPLAFDTLNTTKDMESTSNVITDGLKDAESGNAGDNENAGDDTNVIMIENEDNEDDIKDDENKRDGEEYNEEETVEEIAVSTNEDSNGDSSSIKPTKSKDKAAYINQPEQSGQAGQSEQVGQMEQSGETEQIEQSGQIGQEQAKSSRHSDQADQLNKAERSDEQELTNTQSRVDEQEEQASQEKQDKQDTQDKWYNRYKQDKIKASDQSDTSSDSDTLYSEDKTGDENRSDQTDGQEQSDDKLSQPDAVKTDTPFEGNEGTVTGEDQSEVMSAGEYSEYITGTVPNDDMWDEPDMNWYAEQQYYSGLYDEPMGFLETAQCEENAKQYYHVLRANGFNLNSACGILGNVYSESRFYTNQWGMVGRLYGLEVWQREAAKNGWDFINSATDSAKLLVWSLTSGQDNKMPSTEVFNYGDIKPEYRMSVSEFMQTDLTPELTSDLFCVAFERCYLARSSQAPYCQLSLTASGASGTMYQKCDERKEYARKFADYFSQYEGV